VVGVFVVKIEISTAKIGGILSKKRKKISTGVFFRGCILKKIIFSLFSFYLNLDCSLYF
jgi:hypothetical protein